MVVVLRGEVRDQDCTRDRLIPPRQWFRAGNHSPEPADGPLRASGGSPSKGRAPPRIRRAPFGLLDPQRPQFLVRPGTQPLLQVGWLGPPGACRPRNALLADIVPASAYGRAYGFERMMDNLGAIFGSLLALACSPHSVCSGRSTCPSSPACWLLLARRPGLQFVPGCAGGWAPHRGP